MNPTKIDWPGLTHTWNPVYGCLRGCEYCYARELHNKRMKAKMAGKKLPVQYDKPFNEIQYFPERLNIPKKSNIIKKIFVGSMSDIFYWDADYMERVLDVCSSRPEMTFMFLSKFPSVYRRFKYSQNCMLGVTVTSNIDHLKTDLLLKYVSYSLSLPKTFVSIEPILGDCSGLDLTDIDLVIVGPDTRKGTEPPKKEWIESIKHPNIHYKNNFYLK